MITSFFKRASIFILPRGFIKSPQVVIPLSIAFRTISTLKHDPDLKTVDLNDSKDNISNNVPLTRRGTRSTKQKHSRRIWTTEEDEKLKQLFSTLGPQYTRISKELVNRSPSTICNRCKTLSLRDHGYNIGPWKKEELEALRQLTVNHKQEIDWLKVQRQLPNPRPLSLIRHTWYHTINPRWNHGRWSEKETEQLEQLIAKHGIKNWCAVSDNLKTRSPRQCLEKYRYQMAPTHKGRFTPKEDHDIMTAVEKFGATDFMKIKEFIKSDRTARQISQHYRYALDPTYDRSEWSTAESELVYRTYVKLGNDMTKVKEHLGSRRHVKDMWNHTLAVKRRHELYQRAEEKDLDQNLE